MLKSKNVDILILGEGTYPYIRGGVSSWIHQLITGLPQFKFGILFLGSRRQDYDKIQYEFPKNLVYFDEFYLFDKEDLPEPKRINLKKEKYKRIEDFHKNFRKDGSFDIEVFLAFFKEIKEEQFLYSNISWEYIVNIYNKMYRNESFIDYFWTIRNMHSPIWRILETLGKIPKIKLVHSPSTGYAGFLGALISVFKRVPYILTEHGIYTRERKIDLLTSDWLEYRKINLLQGDDEHYIKDLWIRFFESIGKVCYMTANKILSLYDNARKVQIGYGAPAEKTQVIPNGVNLTRLENALKKRPEDIPKVIGLIGRVVPIKDIKTFIKAMRIVVSQIPDAEGWIVGPTDEDPFYYQECLNLVETLKLENNVKFLGFQNILDIFPKIGINTLTSISEGMPLTILEGFGAGVPAITTDVGSCEELIYGRPSNKEDLEIGQAGIVCQVANPKELADAYIKLLTDKDLWKSCQKAGLERVRRFYSQEMFLNSYKRVYEEALKWQG